LAIEGGAADCWEATEAVAMFEVEVDAEVEFAVLFTAEIAASCAVIETAAVVVAEVEVALIVVDSSVDDVVDDVDFVDELFDR
jgi:hypothetical protein